MSLMSNIPDQERDRIFSRLKSVQNNNICIECDKKNPKWASIHLAIFLCYDCSGKHRHIGPKLSLVKSMTIDSWAQKYILFMEHGGNQKFIDYMKKHGVNYKSLDWETNQAVKKYKQELGKAIDQIITKQSRANNNSEQQQQQQQTQEVTQQLAGVDINQQQQEQQEQQIQQEKEQMKEGLSNKPAKVVTSNVVFNSKSKAAGGAKTKLRAEKVEDFDWDSLAFDDGADKKKEKKQDFQLYEEEEQDQKKSNNDFFSDFGNGSSSTSNNNKNGFSKQDNQFSSSNNNGNSSSTNGGADNFDKYKQKNAKAISSEGLFKQEEPSYQDKQSYSNLAGSKAISSDAFFGRESNDIEDNSGQQIENLKNFFWNVKEKATTAINKAKDNWK